jgi:hypothetical protein
MTTTHVLAFPYFFNELIVEIDAYDTSIGTVLP